MIFFDSDVNSYVSVFYKNIHDTKKWLEIEYIPYVRHYNPLLNSDKA